MRRLGPIAIALVAAAGLLCSPSAHASSAYPFTPVFGTNADSELPVTVSLPAPADGSAVTTLTFEWATSPTPWETSSAPPGNLDGQYVVDQTGCAAASACTVTATIPSGSMSNGTVTVTTVAADANGELGTAQTTVSISNAKPTVTAAWPTYSKEWAPSGTASVTADPEPSIDGVPITDVKLYDSSSSTAQPIAEATSAPWTLTFDSSVLGAQGTIGRLSIMAQDAHGNFVSTSEATRVEPAATVSAAFEDGAIIGSALNSPDEGDVQVEAAVPDSVSLTTDESDEGVAVSWPAGIRGFEFSIDGGTPVQRDWAEWWTDTPTPPRSIDYSYQLPDDLTGGTHTIAITAETTYGSETTTTTHFVLAAGARFSSFSSAGKAVSSSTIFAVGKKTPLSVVATNITPGAGLSSPAVYGIGLRLVSAVPSDTSSAGAGKYTFTTGFTPTKPGAYYLVFCVESTDSSACANGAPDGQADVLYARAEYESRLAFASVKAAGKTATVTGAVSDTVDGHGLGKVPVSLERKQGKRWRTVAKATSIASGKVIFHVSKAPKAAYRLVTAGTSGKVTAATSPSKSF